MVFNKTRFSMAFYAFLLIFGLSVFIPAQVHATEDAKRILSLVDYIGGDYRNAVSDGEIINNDEYAEMLEFSSQVNEIFGKLESEGGDKAGIGRGALSELSALIDNKSPVSEVESVSQLRVKQQD